MMFNTTCNTTLEDLRIFPTSEVAIAGPLTFHELALIIAGGCTVFAIAMSFYLITMHAIHYTKPREQKHIIRILFMIPIYAASSFLSLRFYWHAVYFQVVSDCYEAFAISSFFALLCHYVGPDLHEQKDFFRKMRPVKRWVWPVNWMAKCCGGDRGLWRTPKSGLTWFNIIWIGIYHYCFIRVAMTVTAVTTQHFDRYCESSNSPVFSHIWVIALNALAVTVAMYCVIQFYIQLKEHLSEHSPFLKVAAIKLVIFLSFWQTAAISVGTSTLDIVHANDTIAYPDLKIGIPALLLTFEMALFSILHIWAFSYRPYLDNAPTKFYPVPDPDSGVAPKMNEHCPRAGGFMGLRAIVDAINLWDVVKAFGRGIRWLFVGVKHRHDDVSYQKTGKPGELDDLSPRKRRNGQFDYDTEYDPKAKSTDHLPIATEFRRSKFGLLQYGQQSSPAPESAITQQDQQEERTGSGDETVGLMNNAQPMPGRRTVATSYQDEARRDYGQQNPFSDDQITYDQHPALREQHPALRGQNHYYDDQQPYGGHGEQPIGMAQSQYGSSRQPFDEDPYPAAEQAASSRQNQSQGRRNSAQTRVGETLWGPREGHRGGGGGGDGPPGMAM